MSSLACPSCQASVVLGEQRCGGCGSSLLMAPPPESAVAVCAVHPAYVSVHSCARCGTFACAACLRSGPTGTLSCVSCQERARSELLPWDQREELGLMTAFWQTCVEVMLRPSAAFTRAQPQGRVRDSLLFVLLSTFTGFFTSIVIYCATSMVFPDLEKLPSQGTEGIDADALRSSTGALFVFCVVMAPLVNLVGTLVAAVTDHVALRIARASSSFSTTLRGHALSQGVFLLGLVPVYSLYVMPLWSLGVRIIAYQKLHRVGWGRATAGALLGLLLLCGLFVSAFFAMLMVVLWMAFSEGIRR